MLTVHPGFVTTETAQTLREICDPLRNNTPMQSIYPDEICGSATPHQTETYLEVCDQIVTQLQLLYGSDLELETNMIVMMRPGSRHTLHADAEQETETGWGPNHTPNRTHAGLLYLTQDGPDHTGGIFRCHNTLVSSMPGTLVTLPSTHHYQHEVTMVEWGERINLSIWVARSE